MSTYDESHRKPPAGSTTAPPEHLGHNDIPALSFPYCTTCNHWVYPAAETCPDCGQAPIDAQVPGTGVVFTHTVNHHPYQPDISVPYVIALVEIDHTSGLRVITNIVGCDPDAVQVGMRVRVRVDERGGETVFPEFVPWENGPA